ncbi:CGNR zinc finger domain-containing protein [Actinoplanes bogorensis]|uniref:CGNR zinc finger domain-containing protein n=1 Tax=Paractinoplanes bogorensis TaxID=1610840 RepID=A0ABS5YQD0_9ACTN|nr:CGNR zinc finger domain-containing protein [Actinoplanes bogorensis]MBU2664215.1 CGNR zinc finger domain-containing protein [Actinoplanes bogorensis]
MRIEEMSPAEVVTLVNAWGTLPSRADGRDPRPGHENTILADELHPIFAADNPVTRASLVTGLLQVTAVRPELAPDLTTAWTVDDPAQARRAAAALALLHHPDRIGVCTDGQCADVYVDTSPAGRRRFCCVTCQNRARAAAFRRRRAESR